MTSKQLQKKIEKIRPISNVPVTERMKKERPQQVINKLNEIIDYLNEK